MRFGPYPLYFNARKAGLQHVLAATSFYVDPRGLVFVYFVYLFFYFGEGRTLPRRQSWESYGYLPFTWQFGIQDYDLDGL